MSLRNKTRYFGECAAVCLGFVFIPFLPRSWVLGLSRVVGNIAFRFSRKLRKVAMANMDIVYGADISLDRKEEILAAAFRNFALLLLDLFWFAIFTLRRLKRYVVFDSSIEYYFNTVPIMTVTGHIGNWEVMAQSVSLRNAACSSVATPINNTFVDWVLNRQRRVTGQEVIPRRGAVRSILKRLRNKGRIAMVMDQNTLPESGGVFVNFFGLPVPISNAVEVMTLRTEVPILFVYGVLGDKGIYHICALPPLKSGDAEYAEGMITQKIAALTEVVIRKYPDKWLWMYKRWKFVPQGVPMDGYPYYARPVERK